MGFAGNILQKNIFSAFCNSGVITTHSNKPNTDPRRNPLDNALFKLYAVIHIVPTNAHRIRDAGCFFFSSNSSPRPRSSGPPRWRPSLGPRHRRRARRASLYFRPGVPVHRSTVRNPIRGIGRRLVPARSRGVLLLLPRLRPQRPAFRLGGLPRPRPARLSPLRLPVHAGFLRTARSGLPQHRGPGGLPAASSRHPRNGGHAPGSNPRGGFRSRCSAGASASLS